MTTSPPEDLRDLRQLKRRAKELLRAFRAAEPAVTSQVEEHFPGADPRTFRLSQAQLVLARSMGYRSWARLREAAGVARPTQRPRVPPKELHGRYLNDVDPVDGEQAWQLFQACRDGDLATVRTLLKEDPALVHAQYWYTQPVHLAAYGNHPEVVAALFEAGAAPGRTRWAGGWMKLEEHARALGLHRVLDTVHDAAREAFGYRPDFGVLRDAIVAREPNAVRDLLHTRPELGEAADIEGNNTVHWAVMTRQPGLLEPLIDAGGDPDHRRGDGQTPAHLLFNGDYHFRVGRELVGVRHADQATMLGALVAAGATTDLSVACASGNVEQVEVLLAADPARARRLDSGRRNPLTYAARAGHTDIVRTLLSHGADPSAPEESSSSGWALWWACSRGDVEMVRLLLEGGADPSAAPDSSDSCIGIARARAGSNADEIVDILIAAGASTPRWHLPNEELREAIRSRAPISREPWFAEEALARNDLDLAQALLDHDPEVPRQLTGGRLRLGSPDVAITESAVLRLLLERGFDPDRPSWLGTTALHHYAGRGELGNVVLLLEHGSDIDALDDEHRGTPLAWASAGGHVDVVRVLLEHGADPSLPHDVPAARPAARARRAAQAEILRILEEHARWTTDEPGESA